MRTRAGAGGQRCRLPAARGDQPDWNSNGEEKRWRQQGMFIDRARGRGLDSRHDADNGHQHRARGQRNAHAIKSRISRSARRHTLSRRRPTLPALPACRPPRCSVAQAPSPPHPCPATAVQMAELCPRAAARAPPRPRSPLRPGPDPACCAGSSISTRVWDAARGPKMSRRRADGVSSGARASPPRSSGRRRTSAGRR